jgi:1-acyl-sn-glycerol-3-phosphate acyltransferase
MANELSVTGNRELDILLIGAVFPPYTSVSAKSSLKYVPVLGQFSTFSQPPATYNTDN